MMRSRNPRGACPYWSWVIQIPDIQTWRLEMWEGGSQLRLRDWGIMILGVKNVIVDRPSSSPVSEWSRIHQGSPPLAGGGGERLIHCSLSYPPLKNPPLPKCTPSAYSGVLLCNGLISHVGVGERQAAGKLTLNTNQREESVYGLLVITNKLIYMRWELWMMLCLRGWNIANKFR